MDERRLALVDFMAAEHRLRRQAVRERQEVELWVRRAAFALDRDLGDMAREAQTRAERHRRMEQMLLERAEEIRAEIDDMRAALQTTRGVGRAPPLGGDDLDARLAQLEVDAELDAIRAAVGARRSPEPGTRAQEPNTA